MRLLTICAVLALSTACSIEERGAPGTNPKTKLDLSSGNDSVAITLSAPEKARRGDAVPIIITVRNATARPLDLALAGREIAFDITVSHGDSIIWQRLFGQMIPGILQLKKLQPEEAFELMDTWLANVAPGDYDVAAKILTDARPLVPDPIKIRVQ